MTAYRYLGWRAQFQYIGRVPCISRVRLAEDGEHIGMTDAPKGVIL